MEWVVKSPKLRLNGHDNLRRRAAERAPGCWVWSPGRIYFYKVVAKALVALARQRGWEVQRVDHIRVANLEGESRLWIFPTSEEDPERITLHWSRTAISANLSDQLVEWDLALPRKMRRRFYVQVNPPVESPVGPALLIDLNAPVETKLTDRRRNKAQVTPDTPPA